MKENVPIIHKEKPNKGWKIEQEEKKKEECKLVMYVENKEIQWYIDSGCSKHMIGDQSKFTSLNKEKRGNVTFGNDVPSKVIRKCIVSLRNERTKAKNVSFVEGLKHNLLSVSHISD